MSQEKIILELTRNQAIAVTELLAAAGDLEAEEIAIELRNKIGLGKTYTFCWQEFDAIADEEQLYRILQINDEAPSFELYNEEDECWDLLLDSEGNGSMETEELLLKLALTCLHLDDEEDD